MKKAIFGVAFVATFAAGFECGGNFVQKCIVKRVKDKAPLIANAMASVCNKIAQENLTSEEVNRLIQDELNFMMIVED
jgi:hypothetical protein